MAKQSTQLRRILTGLPRSTMPKDLLPMSPTLIPEPFNDAEWQFEIKWDGFRMLAYCAGDQVQLRSKNNHSFNQKFSEIKIELERLNLNAVLDGEVVILNEKGIADFNKIMYSPFTGVMVYYVFDILWYDGYNLMNASLVDRRKLLKSILPASNVIRFSDHIDRKGKDLFKLAQQHRIEGIVGKRKESLYLPGRQTKEWLKIKVSNVTQGVIAGFIIEEEKEGNRFSSLIIAQKKGQGYKYIGQVGTGVNKRVLDKVLKAKPAKSIFSPIPNVNRKTAFNKPIKKPKIVWIQPEIWCEVKYLELDHFGVMRHPSFKGLLHK